MLTREQVDAIFAWHIEARQALYRDANDQLQEVPGRNVLVREDRNFALGVASKGYGIIQPLDQMNLLHAAVGDGEAEYINGGIFEGGKRLYLQVAIKGANFDVAGQEHAAYCLLGSANDTTGSAWFGFTPTRLSCMNQLKFALRTLRNRITIRHTKNAAVRMATVTALMERARGFFGVYNEEAHRLVRQRFTIQDMRALVEELWPTPKSDNLVPGIERTRARVIQLFDGGQLGADAINGTRYGALNAVVEFIDHHQQRRGGPAGRMDSILFGSQPAVLKQEAYDRLAA